MRFLLNLIPDLLADFETAIVNLFECVWRHVRDKGGDDLVKIFMLASDVDFVEAEAAKGEDGEEDEPIAAVFEGSPLVHFVLNKQRGTICSRVA